MTESMAPEFVTPPSGPLRLPVTSIVPTGRPLDEGIKLFLNQDGHGFILEKESDGLWLAPVENTTVPAARGGSTLRHKRWAEGDSFLVLSLHSPSPEHMYDMFARLVEVVTDQGNYFDLVVLDPYSQEARRRTFLYDSGLEDLGEVTSTYHTVGITAKFLSPFWRGPERVVSERIAPPVKPLITADPGSPVNRWDDPGFEDTVAYEPWFVVDGGLEKQGTGDDHGTFVGNHRVSVNPGETVSVSADVSYVDGPNVGDIQVKVRAYDSVSALVDGSEQTVISESYGGTYTSTYVVPETGVEIELGFYTASDVHANTRARIDNLDVKRDVQYLARYEWEGEPHASPSVKRVNGEIVARNIMPNPQPSADDGPADWAIIRGDIEQLDGSGVRVTVMEADVAMQIRAVSHDYMALPGGHKYVAYAFEGRSPHMVIRADIQTSLDGVFQRTLSRVETKSAPEDWELISQVVEIDHDADGVSLRIGNGHTPELGEHFDFKEVIVATAATEEDALAQVEYYFDGDTPDVLDEGSIEGAYSFPFFPIFLADSTVQGEHEVRVEGDAPVWPVWEITGPGRDVEIIGPDGSRLFVEGEVSSPIRIVTEPGKRSISDESGLIWERMKPGDDQLFALRPGTNHLKMTMVGGTPESTIRAVYSENWKTPRGTANTVRGGV